MRCVRLLSWNSTPKWQRYRHTVAEQNISAGEVLDNMHSKAVSSPMKTHELTTSYSLKDRFWQCISARQHEIDQLRFRYGNTVIGSIDVNTLYGGMRDMPGLLCETSLVDGQAGLLLRGLTIAQCRKKLPTFKKTVSAGIDNEPMAEGAFWLLCTGEVPTASEAESLRIELRDRSVIPDSLHAPLNSLPRTMHPMTQLTIALMLMGSESETAKMYDSGNKLSTDSETHNVTLWNLFYEDCMNLLARLPLLCAFVYHRTYGQSPPYAKSSKQSYAAANEPDFETSDWCGRFIDLLGLHGDPDFAEFFRLSTLCHCDHENGSVYAHTNHILSSALTDPYRAYAGALNGLAGPLHGLANQHALLLYKTITASLDSAYVKHGFDEQAANAVYDDLQIENYVRGYLEQPGRIMPGYGHAVLRSHDPRYLAVHEFASKRKIASRDKLIKFERQLARIVPRLLMEKSSKVKCPWPNIDANSGVMLNYFGIPYHSFYTVFFAIAGSLGPMASTLWSRGLQLPMEEPESLSSAAAMKLCNYEYKYG